MFYTLIKINKKKVRKTMIIINKKITNAIELLRCFDKENQYYYLSKLNLCNSEKGFIYLYLGLNKVL